MKYGYVDGFNDYWGPKDEEYPQDYTMYDYKVAEASFFKQDDKGRDIVKVTVTAINERNGVLKEKICYVVVVKEDGAYCIDDYVDANGKNSLKEFMKSESVVGIDVKLSEVASETSVEFYADYTESNGKGFRIWVSYNGSKYVTNASYNIDYTTGNENCNNITKEAAHRILQYISSRVNASECTLLTQKLLTTNRKICLA